LSILRFTFWRCKNSDTFKPMGPFIVTSDEVDPLASTTPVLVDGAVQASFPTGDPLFGPYDYISGMRVEVVKSAPHSMYWETPQLFNDAVASFLKDVATA